MCVVVTVVVDPFSNAKALIQQSRDKNIANNYGMVAGSYKAFTGNRQFSASNTSAHSAYTVTAPTKPTASPAAAVVPVESFHSSVQLGPPTATYGAPALGVPAASTPAPSAPIKTPPPLPSAPPPSHAPPPVPAPSVVQGFGSQVTSTVGLPASSSSYGSGSLAQSLGSSSYSASNGMPAAGGLAYSGSAPAQSQQPTISAYQSSFGAPSSAPSVASASSYGTPLTPLDSGLPGFGGGGLSTTAGGSGVPSVYNPSALTAAPPATATTGFGNTPVEEPKKRSSWWSSAKPKAGTGNKESLMDAPAGDLYQPPVIPGASYSSSSSAPSYGGSSGITAAPDDLDDFLSSFGKSAAPSTMASSSAKPAATAMGAGFSAAPAPAFRSSFGASTGSYNPTAISPAPSVSSASTGAASGLSIEQQIAAAQAEIARLSASQQAPAQSAWPSQPATQHFGYGAQPAAGMGGGYGQQQQQGYYGNAGTAAGYAPPQAGAMPGQYGYNNAQQGGSVYQPPAGYYNQHNAAPAAASKSTVSDAFDFLN